MSKHPHKVLFINGPPRSGKDTAGAFIGKRFGWRHYQMKAPLWRGLQAFFDIPDNVFHKLFTDPELKEQPTEHLADDTARHAQISLSEHWAKKRYGKDIFGRLAMRTLSKSTLVAGTYITDVGFEYECIPIIEYFGPENCALIQLHRDGCGFAGDSRNYIDLRPHGVRFVKMYNCYDKGMFEAQVVRMVEKWIEEK